MQEKNEIGPYKVVATFELQPNKADEEISRIDRDESLLNLLREQPGFQSYEVVKTAEDSTMTLQTWESEDTFQKAMETVQANRAPQDRENIVIDRDWYAGEVVLTTEQDSTD